MNEIVKFNAEESSKYMDLNPQGIPVEIKTVNKNSGEPP
jgi:hypothetical protein